MNPTSIAALPLRISIITFNSTVNEDILISLAGIFKGHTIQPPVNSFQSLYQPEKQQQHNN